MKNVILYNLMVIPVFVACVLGMMMYNLTKKVKYSV